MCETYGASDVQRRGIEGRKLAESRPAVIDLIDNQKASHLAPKQTTKARGPDADSYLTRPT